MATTSAYLFAPPQAEDSMDVSSPERRADDNDIDIDLDDYTAPVGDNQADADMLDESKDHDELLDDEVMLDDEHAAVQVDSQQHATYAPEDDLIDYSDDEDLPLVPPVIAKPSAEDGPVTSAEVTQQEIREPITQLVAQAGEEESGSELPAEITEPLIQSEEHEDPDVEDEEIHDHEELLGDPAEEHDPGHSLEEITHEVDDDAKLPLEPEAGLEHPAHLNVASVPSVQDEEGTQVGLLENEVSESHDAAVHQESKQATTQQNHSAIHRSPSLEPPGTPTDTGLHPVVFYWRDTAYPLFKSKSSPDGLLKDDNFVSVSLADLIKACRQRIAIKTDEDISEQFEVVLKFEAFHLTVVEDSPASFQTCLKDVLDVYVHLHENDGIEPQDIPALEISCNVQVKFNSSIEILQKAASIGDGMSNFIEPHVTYTQTDDIQHDDYEDVDNGENEIYNVAQDEEHTYDEADHLYDDTKSGYQEHNDVEEAANNENPDHVATHNDDGDDEAYATEQEQEHTAEDDLYDDGVQHDTSNEDPTVNTDTNELAEQPRNGVAPLHEHEDDPDHVGDTTPQTSQDIASAQAKDIETAGANTTKDVTDAELPNDTSLPPLEPDDDDEIDFDFDDDLPAAPASPAIQTKTTPMKRGRDDGEAESQENSKRRRSGG